VEDEAEGAEILKKRIYSDVPLAESAVACASFIEAFDQLVVQANAKYPIAFYLLLSLFLDSPVFTRLFLLRELQLRGPGSLRRAAVALCVFEKRQGQTDRKIQAAAPGCPGLIAAALKAGHAFTGGMSMLSEEFDDPIGARVFGSLGRDQLRCERFGCPQKHGRPH